MIQDPMNKLFMAADDNQPNQNKPKKGLNTPQKPDGEFDWGKVIKAAG